MIYALSCVAIGLILIYIEFFLPGTIMGIIGGLFLLASVFLFILTKPKLLILLSFIAALIFLVFLVIKLALFHVKKTSKKNTFFLKDDQEGYVASLHQERLIGQKAIAASDLKPSGHIRVQNELFQAVAKNGYIKKGEEVLIIAGEGARLIVKKNKSEE